jgi:hypothetical protein
MSRSEFRGHFDGNRELFYSSVHEAGHVMAARDLGFRVAWVSIDPEFIKSDPLAIKNDVADDGVLAVSMVLASERVPKSVAANARGREIVLEYAMEIMCGPLAERLVNPDYWQTAYNDFDQAKFWLRRVLAPTNERYMNKIWNKVENRANKFVDVHESAILEFANILMAERTIREAEIDRFILKAKSAPDVSFV